MEDFKLNTIEEAIADFREGKFIIVVDDEDRENEGDFIIAAEKITPEKVNFMLKEGRGVLCAPITLERCAELELEKQVSNNTSILGTPFTVTIDKLEAAQPASRLMTVPLRFRHWLTQIQLPLLSDVRDISILCMHKIKVY